MHITDKNNIFNENPSEVTHSKKTVPQLLYNITVSLGIRIDIVSNRDEPSPLIWTTCN